MLGTVDPSDWIALTAVGSGVLTSLAALYFNSRVTRRTQDQQAMLLERQLGAELERARDERLWSARADTYASYLGWLRSTPREILKYGLDEAVRGDIPASWWKTPYELGNKMRLFESERVAQTRSALTVALASIAEAVSTLSASPVVGEPGVREGMTEAAADALRVLDELVDAVRADMHPGESVSESGTVDLLEDVLPPTKQVMR